MPIVVLGRLREDEIACRSNWFESMLFGKLSAFMGGVHGGLAGVFFAYLPSLVNPFFLYFSLSLR